MFLWCFTCLSCVTLLDLFDLVGMAREIVVLSATESELLSGQPGKKGYRSPEVVLGQRFDGRAADCFAVGVILFMLLTGAAPFEEAHDQGTSAILNCYLNLSFIVFFFEIRGFD